jgi:hypothetical protein
MVGAVVVVDGERLTVVGAEDLALLTDAGAWLGHGFGGEMCVCLQLVKMLVGWCCDWYSGARESREFNECELNANCWLVKVTSRARGAPSATVTYNSTPKSSEVKSATHPFIHLHFTRNCLDRPNNPTPPTSRTTRSQWYPSPTAKNYPPTLKS